MRTVFADTAYWIALLNSRDRLHETAYAFCVALQKERIVTSDMVLTETLNHFADAPAEFRRMASALVRRLEASPYHRIVPQSSAQFRNTAALYEQRPDKQWSLTDCASFLVMQEEGISEALTHDRHFIQAGFKALLRTDE